MKQPSFIKNIFLRFVLTLPVNFKGIIVLPLLTRIYTQDIYGAWLHTPEGTGSIWVITEAESGKIVGHHGLIPINADYFGKALLLGKTENTILHPKYLGTGIYFIHEKRFLQEAVKRFDLLEVDPKSRTIFS